MEQITPNQGKTHRDCWLVVFIITLVLFSFWTSSAHSHSGGLNASGCHAGSKPYHCHRSSSEMVVTSTGRNRLRCSLASRSEECFGEQQRRTRNTRTLVTSSRLTSSTPDSLPEPKANIRTYSAGRPFSYSILRMQIQLRRHCGNLSENFADGIFGPITRAALLNFQRSHGLEADGIIGPKTARALARTPTGRCK